MVAARRPSPLSPSLPPIPLLFRMFVRAGGAPPQWRVGDCKIDGSIFGAARKLTSIFGPPPNIHFTFTFPGNMDVQEWMFISGPLENGCLQWTPGVARAFMRNPQHKAQEIQPATIDKQSRKGSTEGTFILRPFPGQSIYECSFTLHAQHPFLSLQHPFP